MIYTLGLSSKVEEDEVLAEQAGTSRGTNASTQ